MTHLGEGTLQAYLDAELGGEERDEAERHLAACAHCRRERTVHLDLGLDLSAALRAIPHAPPTELALRRVRATSRRRALTAPRTLRRAAVILLAVGGVASATVPGSPVRPWVERWLGELGVARNAAAPAEDGRPHATPIAPPTAAAAPAEAGVSVLPAGGSLRVSLRSPGPGLRVRVRLSDDPFGDVSGSGAAAGARFRTSPGRIEVTEATGGELVVAVPRTARVAVVEVDGRVYLRKDAAGLLLAGAAGEDLGSEVSFTIGR